MACNWTKLPDGTLMHLRTSKRYERCYRCRLMSEFQCDFPTEKGKTCDRYLCSDHVCHGKTKGVDFCEEHFPIAKAAYEKRQEKLGIQLLFGPMNK